MSAFKNRLSSLIAQQNAVITRKNEVCPEGNGWYDKYRYPVLTSAHIPLYWKIDLNETTNPFCMERLGVNCVFNPGAIEFDGKIVLVARVEGYDRKSFFAVAESSNGVDNFRFWDKPIVMPETDVPDVNVYDMRLVRHEDGYIYGLFCTERKDTANPDLSAAVAQCGIARTKDLVQWERLPDLVSKSPQQRNAVLHPEFINGKYAFYTRPQDDFISTGSGGGIGWGLCASMENPVLTDEIIINRRQYHTITEIKNGQGPAPIKTKNGWLHIAHGVRNTAAGLRYVLYVFMSDLNEPWKITHTPGGFFMSPEGEERVGDVSNVVFCNGAVAKDNGEVYIYYASSDTRSHVAVTTVDKLVDYATNTPADPLRSFACVAQRNELIDRNLTLLNAANDSTLSQALGGSVLLRD